jgi:hypothetical protein
MPQAKLETEPPLICFGRTMKMPIAKCLFGALMMISILSGFSCRRANHARVVGDIGGHSTNGPASFEKAASAITDILVARYSDGNGATNFADVFNALGALAGFGCQMAVREAFIKPGIVTLDKAFVVVTTKDGGKYFFGDWLNTPLLSEENGQVSVWSLVGAASQAAGAKALPDVLEIVEYNAKTLGTKDFGIPRVPEQYRSRELPIDILKKDWPAMQKLLVDYQVDPRVWGWTFAQAAQNLILKNKDDFDPGAAAKIVMEAALPMSKIDPATLPVADTTIPN